MKILLYHSHSIFKYQGTTKYRNQSISWFIEEVIWGLSDGNGRILKLGSGVEVKMQEAQNKETLGLSEGRGTCCQTGISHLKDNTDKWSSKALAPETPKRNSTSLCIFFINSYFN